MKKIQKFNLFFAALLLCVLASCGKTKDFEFRRIQSLDLHDISFMKSSISGRLLFYNPNRYGVTLKHLESEVTVDGNKLGTCTSDSTIRIKSREEFSVPVVIHFTTAAAIFGGLNFLTKDSVHVRFQGSMHVGRAGIFINYKFDNTSKVSTKF